jgi:hypothetical protein
MVRKIKGKEYLYAKGRIADGSLSQVYLGPLDDNARKVMERFNQQKKESNNDRDTIKYLGKMLRAAGVPSLDPIESRVLSALAAEGVFRVDGILVGTIAYRCIVGSLGFQVRSAMALTADIDIAGVTIPIVVTPEVVCPKSALERLEMGFSPMYEAEAKLFGSRFEANNTDFKVEFLTPLVGKESEGAVSIRQFNVPAIPLRFLSYLVEKSVSAVALGRQPILVRVPSPERYAVHKLIVSQERRNQPLKAQKDLEQSYDLQRILKIIDPEELEDAFDIARQQGPGWRKRVDAGQEAMIRLFGDPKG